MKTDIDIAREAEITAIGSIASKLGIGDEYLEQYGKFKAKVNLSIKKSILNRPTKCLTKDQSMILDCLYHRFDTQSFL